MIKTDKKEINFNSIHIEYLEMVVFPSVTDRMLVDNPIRNY